MALSNSITLNDLVGQIVSRDVQTAAYSTRVMRQLVRNYNVPAGAGSIVVPRFQAVSVTALTEGVAPSSTTMSTDGVTLTPTERGTYVQISKRALHADPFQDLAPYGEQLGRALAQDEDAQVLTAATFTTKVGSAVAIASDSPFRAAIAALEAANAPQPYAAVFHPLTWAKLRGVFANWATFASVGKQTVEGFGEGSPNQGNGYVGSPYGVPCYISTQVAAHPVDTTARANVMFSKEALSLAFIQDIGVDVFDNVVARALDLMAWTSVDKAKLVDAYGVTIEDSLT